MDLERIKQNFRIRSGRTKKAKTTVKAAIATKPAEPLARSNETASAAPDQPKPQANGYPSSSNDRGPTESGEIQEEPKPGEIQEHPKPAVKELPEIDLASPPPHRPDLPHAATGVSSGQAAQKEPLKYGKSGIERPKPGLSHSMTSFSLQAASPSSEPEDFDLRPPAPKSKPPSIETLADHLFSAGHLNSILHQPAHLSSFTAFLHRYRPQDHPYLAQYLETQKAIKAVEYANAVAESLQPKQVEDEKLPSVRQAANLDSEFEKLSQVSFKALTGDALPMFVTYNLLKIGSERLTNEITGRSTTMMKDLVGGLSEVFCLSDPTQADNPIIYASEEFYRLTGYDQDDVIGSNCRFLQGPRTRRQSVQRVREAIEKGEEVCETLLNYRRDGRPFINLLMIAPLHDDKGKIKYHIGAQIDVTRLIQNGGALDTFQRYMRRRETDVRFDEQRRRRYGTADHEERKGRALAKLRDLSEMFDLEESAVVQSHSRATSMTRDDNDSIAGSDWLRPARRVYGEDASSDNDEDNEDDNDSANEWKLGSSGNGRVSGKLPGLYESFMLIRPSPSNRIVFVSPKLRKIGNIIQHPFLAHVAAPGSTLVGLRESFSTGIPVSARVHFMPERGENRDGTKLKTGVKHEDGKHGRACWISCTPLLGGDDRIGVWMIVFVEKARAMRQSKQNRTDTVHDGGRSKMGDMYGESPERPRSGKLEPPDQGKTLRPAKIKSQRSSRHKTPTRADFTHQQPSDDHDPHSEDDVPIKPIRLDSNTVLKTTNDKIHRGTPPVQSEPQSLPTPPSTAPRQALAAESPVEEYEEVKQPTKPYSIEIPSLKVMEGDNDQIPASTSDGYVTTRSPMAPDDDGRVVIADDSDADDEEEEDRPQLSEENLRTHHLQRHGTQSPSPVWSPAAESPLPSSPENDTAKFVRSQRRFSEDDVFAGSRNQETPPPQSSGYKHEPSQISPPGMDSNGEEYDDDFDERPQEPQEDQHTQDVPDESKLSGQIDDTGETDADNNLTPVNTRPNTSSGHKAQASRMDYLSHPGTSRLPGGTWRAGAPGSGEGSIDVECMRSPYSVD